MYLAADIEHRRQTNYRECAPDHPRAPLVLRKYFEMHRRNISVAGALDPKARRVLTLLNPRGNTGGAGLKFVSNITKSIRNGNAGFAARIRCAGSPCWNAPRRSPHRGSIPLSEGDIERPGTRIVAARCGPSAAATAAGSVSV